MRRILGLSFLALAAGLVSGGRLAADRLVLNDGTEIETQGAWEIKGRLVVFQRANGELSSLRVSEVDFARSATATQVANTPPPPPPPPVRKASVMSLTEKELPPVGETEAKAASELAPEAGTIPGLRVVNGWQTVASADGNSTEILGQVRNESNQAALGVQVVAVLIGEGEEVLAQIEGSTSSRGLQAGESTSFRVSFENGLPYERIEMRVTGDLATAAPVGTPATTTADTPPAEAEAADTPPPVGL